MLHLIRYAIIFGLIYCMLRYETLLYAKLLSQYCRQVRHYGCCGVWHYGMLRCCCHVTGGPVLLYKSDPHSRRWNYSQGQCPCNEACYNISHLHGQSLHQIYSEADLGIFSMFCRTEARWHSKGAEGVDHPGQQSGGVLKNLVDNSKYCGDNGKMGWYWKKMVVKTKNGKNGVIRGHRHQASHDFWGCAKLQSVPGTNSPRCATVGAPTKSWLPFVGEHCHICWHVGPLYGLFQHLVVHGGGAMYAEFMANFCTLMSENVHRELDCWYSAASVCCPLACQVRVMSLARCMRYSSWSILHCYLCAFV